MRIGIVNDMFIAVEAMRRVLKTASGHEVAWIARDGVEAVARCAADRPDLILMDLIMPRLGGVEATRQIMAQTPCAIVVVTANVHDNAAQVFEAMGAGALDAVNTPALSEPGNFDGAKGLLAKIETIGRLLGMRCEVRGARGLGSDEPDTSHLTPRTSPPLVVIGASAGGPAALAQVLSALPANFPGAVVIVQHVDEEFAAGLAAWLGGHTALRVVLAEEGDRLRGGTVFLAAREEHLVLASGMHLSYTRQPADCSYQPSVDVFFKSVKRHWPPVRGARGQGSGEPDTPHLTLHTPPPLIGVLLTGMGRDGAEGLRALRDAGHHTIAQDEATSAVFGMPKAARELEAATEILALDNIGPRLITMLVSGNKS